MKRIIKNSLLLLLAGSRMQAITKESLEKMFKKPHPFFYDLGVKVIASKRPKADVMICCHGYGHSNKIADILNGVGIIEDHIISFNFPDFKCIEKGYDPKQCSFGSINELLPLLYVLKACIENRITKINIYGFSAGGGAIINALAVLNQNIYDIDLQKSGIDSACKQKILKAIEKGHIILDCPLKSLEEIIELRGPDPELLILAKQYAQNGMRPIDTLEKLKGLPLTILLHFQNPDEIIGNKDDQKFIQVLKRVNHKGKTEVVIGKDGGHNSFHHALWKKYKTWLNQ